jgi:hypothetical protein
MASGMLRKERETQRGIVLHFRSALVAVETGVASPENGEIKNAVNVIDLP